MAGFEYDMNNYFEELSKASVYFKMIENEEKEVDFNEVKQLILDIDSKKNLLKNRYPLELINKNYKKIEVITKLINKTLDNVVKLREAERNSVALELEKLNNKKKMATYIR